MNELLGQIHGRSTTLHRGMRLSESSKSYTKSEVVGLAFAGVVLLVVVFALVVKLKRRD